MVVGAAVAVVVVAATAVVVIVAAAVVVAVVVVDIFKSGKATEFALWIVLRLYQRICCGSI